MIWDLIRILRSPKSKAKPDFGQQRLLWNVAAKIEQKVRELVADELSIDIALVTPESRWYEDLGCTLDVVEVFMRCEEEFGIEIPDEDAEQCETVGKLTEYIQRKFGVA